MCRTILSRFINSSTHRTAIIVIHHHGQELIHDLDFHLPAQSDSAIDCCDVHRDASPECKWSLWDWHISPSEPLPVSSILSKFVSSIWVARVQQDEAHNMSHPSSWSICWWCWCIVVFCIIPSAETQDFLRSWSLHQWSPVIVYLIDLSINNTVSMLRSSLYLFQHHIAG